VHALPRSRRWSLADVQQLTQLALEGATAEDIARALDRTVEAVRIKAAHQRVPLTLSGRQRARMLDPTTQQPPPAEE
jgi:hypothetical protein